MEFGLQFWLIVIGVVLVVGILLQGLRVQRDRRRQFNLERNGDEFDDDEHGSLGPADEDGDLGDDYDEEPPIGDDDVYGTSSGRQQRDLDATDDEAEEEVVDEGDGPVEVLVVYVVARDPNGFKGPALLQSILESGLRFGMRDIFHRHESLTGNGEILFSMANAVRPGTFDLDDIDHFSTRAVSFFLGLPGPSNPKQALELMLAAARKLSSELDGELKDDQRSVFTKQTEEIYRQRIVEFERRR